MKPTLNEKFLAYLALFSGLTLSIVAEYYSILGLTAIFSAAPVSVIVMGIALGVGKISATLWLKQNWKIAPWTIRSYLLSAIGVLMLITSMGIFGFLSKAHSDASLVSGDVQAKIAVYDEKIKTAKENIDANRKVLKQMDEALDAVLSRSTTETGADRAVTIRRSQQKERARIASEIAAEQKTISSLSAERAPIAAEVRKVEAEVGPIKYIAAFVYGETSEDLLEKAVTWVIIILIVVFDPLAVILLLASQISFQNFREREKELAEGDSPEKESDVVSTATVTTSTGFIAQEVATLVPEAVTKVEETVTVSLDKINDLLAQARQELEEKRQQEIEEELARDRLVEVAKTYIPEKSIFEQHPYLLQPFSHFKDLQPMVYKAEGDSLTTEGNLDVIEEPTVTDITETVVQKALEEHHEVKSHGSGQYVVIDGQTYNKNSVPANLQGYVQNEEQRDSNLWSVATGNPIQPEDYFKTSKNKKI
jgi:regulator of replication initiation timing